MSDLYDTLQKYTEACQKFHTAMDKVRDAMRKLEMEEILRAANSRLSIYERALKVYADGNNWAFPLSQPWADKDKGELARQILANPEFVAGETSCKA